MSNPHPDQAMIPQVIHMPTSAPLTSDQFYDLCRVNPDYRIERTAHGDLMFMAPTGGETGHRNVEVSADFVIWNRQAQLGFVFDSSTGFHLPNGADRSPDVAWVERDRWNRLTPAQREKFPPLAPDFVLELMSPSDSLGEAQSKMEEYMENGVLLGWLLNRKDQQVEIYRLGQPKEILQAPLSLSGEDILPGFELNLTNFWL
jgi:Uma2 family endonuclease